MAFIDIEFPRDVAAGAIAMLERRDELVQLSSGFEETNQRWEHARRSWAAGLGVRSAADLADVVRIFEEVRGRANSFRFRDWLDWESGAPGVAVTASDQILATGDGNAFTFQLVKTYGVVNPYIRPIALPIAGTLRVAIDGVETTDFTLAPIGGTITLGAPLAAGATLTAGYQFDVPVRFVDATLSVVWAYFHQGSTGAGDAPDITLTEVRLDAGLIA